MKAWVIVTGVALLVTLPLIVSIGLQIFNPPPELPTPSLIEGVKSVASVPPVVATLRGRVMEREPWRDGSRKIGVITPTAEAER